MCLYYRDVQVCGGALLPPLLGNNMHVPLFRLIMSEQWHVELKDIPQFQQIISSEKRESHFLDVPIIRIVGITGLSDKCDVGIMDVP